MKGDVIGMTELGNDREMIAAKRGEASSSTFLVELNTSYEKDEIGGKAWNLARLKEAGFPVPDGWVVPSRVFEEHLAASGAVEFVRPSQNEATEQSQQISELLMKTDLSESLLTALRELPEGSLAVRSSASVEDSEHASYSGLFETVLGVDELGAMIQAIKTVWASAFTPEVLAYHRRFSPGSLYPSMAVLIMPMVAAECAGVAFSANPLTGNPFEIAVSACKGLGTGVVDGTADCDKCLLDFDDLHVINHPVEQEVQGPGEIESPVLDSYMLECVGETVRALDELLDYRVDVEFAFEAGQLQVLQTRKIVGLPAYFPGDPTLQDSNLYYGHQNWAEPLPPLLRTPFLRRHLSCKPPWPAEVSGRQFHLGRIIYRKAEDPGESAVHFGSSGDTCAFMQRMLALEDPAEDFKEWNPCTAWAYGELIPDIQSRATRLLKCSSQSLIDLPSRSFAQELKDAFNLAGDALALYVLYSDVTCATLGRLDVCVNDWLLAPGECWKEKLQIVMTLIQGQPKISHQRDAELYEVAKGDASLDEFVCRWGYSFVQRDEIADISAWQSWRENPKPLHNAMELLRKNMQRKTYVDHIRDARSESDRVYKEMCDKLKGDDVQNGKKKAQVLAACVDACRYHFRLKDDRDLILAHAQSALRWLLVAAGQRLLDYGIIERPEEVFLLHEHQLIRVFESETTSREAWRILVAKQRIQQQRLRRYSLDLELPAVVPSDKIESVDEFCIFPASSGIAEGYARVIGVGNNDATLDIEEGEILVLIGEGKMGWTIYFPIIAGLVYSHGNWLCHETNLCRELGIPAVVGTDCINKIQTGDRIRIDGAIGNIKIIARAHA